MDLLPTPENSKYERLQLPYRGEEDYDHGEWKTYLQRQGYEPLTIKQYRSLINDQDQRFCNTLHTWLFWGYLEELFQVPLIVTDYVEVFGDGEIIDLKRLMDELVTTTTVLTSFDPDRIKRVHLDRARVKQEFERGQILETNNQIAPLTRDTDAMFDENKPVSLIHYLNVQGWVDPRDILVCSCTEMAMELMEYFPQESGTQVSFAAPLPTQFHHDTVELRNRLMQDGWCPHEMNMFSQILNISACQYVSCLDRPNPEQAHDCMHSYDMRMRRDADLELGLFQGKCTMNRCFRAQMDEPEYERTHIDSCERLNCKDIAADAVHLDSILDDRNIPIVKAWGSKEKCLIEITTCKPHLPYVAISHVWSDGYGNPRDNAIRTCQLQHFSQLVRQLKSSDGRDIEYFWLDTLCVPPDGQNRSSAQDKAIELMRDTYVKATYILVIENWLMSKSIKKTDNLEIMLRIVCSPWMRR